MRIARAALTCSLALCACCLVTAQYADMSARLRPVNDPDTVVELVSQDQKLSSDDEIVAILERDDITSQQKARDLKAAVDLRAMLEQPSGAPVAKADVKQIKSSPMYRDSGVEQTSNWLARALDRLKAIKLGRDQSPNMGWLSGIWPFLYYLMWFLMAAVVGALLYFAVRHIKLRQRLARKASTLMEESEPERTLDEWLAVADELEAAGRYREAVRALYLACLLRFDEALIARFDRGQTNWEHLVRIERSPKMPEGLDFRTATRLFDRVWYGFHVRGREDAQQFRNWYLEITDALRRKPA